MAADPGAPPRSAGARARKRRETLARITEAGICLFVEKGIEATTVDEIAAAAGISRRSFFHHVRSKDDILLSLQSGLGELLAEAVRAAPAIDRPLDAIREAVIAVCATIPADEMIVIDRLMRSSPAVQARKAASYVQHEESLFAALRDRWPAPDRAAGLRLIALLAIGAIRLASERFGSEGGARPLTDVLVETFAALAREVGAVDASAA